METPEQNPKLWDYDDALAELRQEVQSTTSEDSESLQPPDEYSVHELSISQRYLSAELLRCIGCIVQRNNGEVPPAMVTTSMLVNCIGSERTIVGPVLRHIANQKDAPVALDTRVTSIVRYALTDQAVNYVSEPPEHCAEITGNLPRPVKPPKPPKPKKEPKPAPVPKPAQTDVPKPDPKPAKPPKPIKLTKTVKQVKAARSAYKKKQQLRPPVDLTKKTPRMSANARDKVSNSLIATCLNCIANRRADYVGLYTSARMLGECTGMSRSSVQRSVQRLVGATRPPLVQKGPKSSYQLSPAAKNDQLEPTLPTCQFDKIFAGQAENSPHAAKRRTENVHLQKEVIQRYAEPIADATARKHAETLLARFVERNILRITVVYGPEPKTAPSNITQQYTIVAGERLTRFTPAMQKAYFYAMGVDRIVYGQPTDLPALREQLQLLPLDSVRALGNLVAYRLKYQQEPADYIDPDDKD